jgi:uncharacterized membrane protein
VSGPWLLALPLGAPAIRGFVQPVIKLGLERWHNPIAAVVIGYTVSSAVLILAALMPGRASEHKFDRRGALWFATIGLCNGSAVLSMHAALGRGPVTLAADCHLSAGDAAAELSISQTRGMCSLRC